MDDFIDLEKSKPLLINNTIGEIKEKEAPEDEAVCRYEFPEIINGRTRRELYLELEEKM